ncbi:ATP/GTP-binding protein [Streptomyces sp. MBT49]|uniref:ATP/GTP-binding protein n=1 Tax=Streptomyces sp. MBT49 TaxID=1488380 RepID=UPI00190A43C3|nr:ATP/GTP-binding protein [Streptomyces sp. MBT49]MBK3628211.1 ATP/GTP-binding protein [Streptomyces sp. MBT49]
MTIAPDPTVAPPVDLAKPQADVRDKPATREMHYARAELALALPDHLALREVPLTPDPLEALANAVADVREDLGESADVMLDLVPVAPNRVGSRRRRLLAQARRNPSDGPAIPGMPQQRTNRFGFDLGAVMSEIATEMKGNQGGGARQHHQQQRTHRVADMKAAMGKLAPGAEPVFSMQLLVRTCARDEYRARMLLDQVLAALEPWSGDNHLRPVGLHLGVTRVRSDHWLYRHKFDRRFETGLFVPRRHSWVTAQEIAGLLKPPTKHNNAPNITRSGGVVPPPPAALPTWTGQQGLLPLGWVSKSGGGERLAGVPLKYLLFALFLGKSGFGKTEMSLVQAIALAHNGFGVLFLDPHGDGWTRARPYLAHKELADRIWEIDLTSPELDKMVGSWNPLSMERRRESEIPDLVQYIVTGFAAALNWSDSAGRAKTILTRAVESLVYLSWHVCRAGRPELAPTVFQIRTILTDAVWRTNVLPYLPKDIRDFWENVFPSYSKEAVPVVTNIIERLSSSNAIKAFLGSSRSTYDIRHAMDTGKIVFVCPAGTGDVDRIISSLLIYDLFRAGLSRRDTPPDQRRDFYTFIDELTSVDGASKGTLAQITEQLRKYNVKLLAMTQMAQRLSATTRQGLLQNLSILSTTASDVDEATLVTRRWGKKVSPDTIVQLNRYNYVMSVTLDGGTSDPFRVRGASVEDLYGDYFRPQNEERLARAIDENLQRRSVRDILTDLRRLDLRLRRFIVTLDVPPDDDDPTGADVPPDEAGFDEAAPADDEGPGRPTDGTASADGAAKPRVHDSEGTLISGAQPDPDEIPNNVHPINPHQNQSRLG